MTPLAEICLPVKIVTFCNGSHEDSTVEYCIYDSKNRLIATLEWNEQGKKDADLLVQLINSTNL